MQAVVVGGSWGLTDKFELFNEEENVDMLPV